MGSASGGTDYELMRGIIFHRLAALFLTGCLIALYLLRTMKPMPAIKGLD